MGTPAKSLLRKTSIVHSPLPPVPSTSTKAPEPSLHSHHTSSNENSAHTTNFKPNYDYVRSEMLTSHNQERASTSPNNNNNTKNGAVNNTPDVSNNYVCLSTSKMHQIDTHEN